MQTIAMWVILAIAVMIAAWWNRRDIRLAWRLLSCTLRRLAGLMDAGSGQRGSPGSGYLRLVVSNVARRQQCDRCATGNTRLHCACGTDCDAPSCLGWLDDDRRTVLRGDG